MFKGTEIGKSYRDSTKSPNRAKPEMRILNPNDPALRVFEKLPQDYQAFIIEKIKTLAGNVSQQDKISIAHYFLQKYQEFAGYSGKFEAGMPPVDAEKLKLDRELSGILAEVDGWFKVLAKKYESGRQSSPNRVM